MSGGYFSYRDGELCEAIFGTDSTLMGRIFYKDKKQLGVGLLMAYQLAENVL